MILYIFQIYVLKTTTTKQSASEVETGPLTYKFWQPTKDVPGTKQFFNCLQVGHLANMFIKPSFFALSVAIHTTLLNAIHTIPALFALDVFPITNLLIPQSTFWITPSLIHHLALNALSNMKKLQRSKITLLMCDQQNILKNIDNLSSFFNSDTLFPQCKITYSSTHHLPESFSFLPLKCFNKKRIYPWCP